MELYSEWGEKLTNKTIRREFDLLRVVDADHAPPGSTTPKDHQDMMDAQLNLVNDLPGNYNAPDIPARTVVTGPVFPNHDGDDQEFTINDPNLAAFMNANTNESTKKVFICMGSSGHAEHIVSAIQAIIQQPLITKA